MSAMKCARCGETWNAADGEPFITCPGCRVRDTSRSGHHGCGRFAEGEDKADARNEIAGEELQYHLDLMAGVEEDRHDRPAAPSGTVHRWSSKSTRLYG